MPTFFYGHFNMSSLCDIKYTLRRTERRRARENGRKREGKREREGVKKSRKQLNNINR